MMNYKFLIEIEKEAQIASFELTIAEMTLHSEGAGIAQVSQEDTTLQASLASKDQSESTTVSVQAPVLSTVLFNAMVAAESVQTELEVTGSSEEESIQLTMQHRQVVSDKQDL
ncbi:MAG: hypothetical protein AAF471_04485, partial [Myxococcota bacterium]